MPLYKLNYNKAMSNYRDMPEARWHINGEARGSDGKCASHRLKSQTFFIPRITPQLKINSNERIFTIGSCFARAVEVVLPARGICVESAVREIPFQPDPKKPRYGKEYKYTRSLFNLYNTFSIRNSLEWGLDQASSFPEDALLRVKDNFWTDPHGCLHLLPLLYKEEVISLRRIVNNVISRIKKCRVIIITLGLIEVWHDEYTGLFLNTTPTNDPERFSFHLTTFEENMQNLEDIYALLTKYCPTDFQIIVTVSPVPLLATFTGQDIVVANTYSKSLLRAVAEAWVASHDNVHYFPSYEIVMNSDQEIAWGEDRRHVRGAIPEHIVDLFMKSFF